MFRISARAVCVVVAMASDGVGTGCVAAHVEQASQVPGHALHHADPPVTAATDAVTSGTFCHVLAGLDEESARGQKPTGQDVVMSKAKENTTLAPVAAWATEPTALSLRQLLSDDSPDARVRAFVDEARKRPADALGPVGMCWVAADALPNGTFESRCHAADAFTGYASVIEAARARGYRRRGALRASLEAAERATAADPSCAIALFEHARALDNVGEIDRAAAAWARASDAVPSCFLCAHETARVLEMVRGPVDALSAWEAASLLEPAHPEPQRRIGAALADIDPVRALLAYERAIAGGDRSTSTLLAAAELAFEGGDPAKALAFTDDAIRVQPVNIDAWRLILSIAQKSGDSARVRAAAAEVLRLVGDDADAHLSLARLARRERDLVLAVTSYDAMLRLASREAATVSKDQVEAAKRERRALLDELEVKGQAPRGSMEQVVGIVKTNVERTYARRLTMLPPAQKIACRGVMDVAVAVAATGVVDDVKIIRDTLNDPVVGASVVAQLRRATISGGARRYQFQLEFH